MTERARWVLLVLTLAIGLGGLAVFNTIYIDRVERDSQRDFCDLLAVFDDPDAPAPATERSRRQVEALRSYRFKRC